MYKLDTIKHCSSPTARTINHTIVRELTGSRIRKGGCL